MGLYGVMLAHYHVARVTNFDGWYVHESFVKIHDTSRVLGDSSKKVIRQNCDSSKKNYIVILQKNNIVNFSHSNY